MNDLINVVDWSRAQFALTAMYHWLFVPLTLGLGLIVAIMETMWYRTGNRDWLLITKFWMKLFGINFAMGVATGIILEFEFGTNWSNYSWFVGDIFGAPLAIEGLLAFFMEATFVAVMFFGWNKVSRRFHLAATWLTAIGATISALWILVANAWMQYPVGMRFDPAQMRNVMDNFWAVALSPVAVNKFCHAVTSGWTLGGAFVLAVSALMFYVGRQREFALQSLKVGSWVGIVGLVLTMVSGHGSAVEVAQKQPMKLAAMEGLYDGSRGQSIVVAGMLNPAKTPDNDADPYLWHISIPKGLSFLINPLHPDGFVPGISDLIDGRCITSDGDTLQVESYMDRIACGREAHAALRDFDIAMAAGDTAAMAVAEARLAPVYKDFGYGYFDSPLQAVPPVGLTFYSFHIMVLGGGALLLMFAIALLGAYRRQRWLDYRVVAVVLMLSLPVVYAVSQCGWITAEVGRQPWLIQDIMPTIAAVSAIPVGSIKLTFWLFAAVFTGLLAAEIGIMVRQISNKINDKG